MQMMSKFEVQFEDQDDPRKSIVVVDPELWFSPAKLKFNEKKKTLKKIDPVLY